MPNFRDISIALAAVCQSAALVQQLATKGNLDHTAYQTSLHSLLVFQPESTLSVFGNQLEHLKYGLETALAQFGGRQGKLDTQIGRYWIGLLALSQKLDRNQQAKSELVQRLQHLERQVALCNGNVLEETVLKNMSAIYSDIISPLGSRIRVFGVAEILSRNDIQIRVRALLLAGIRAGILWQQVGGSRWQFLFSRKKLLNEIQSLYSSL